MPNHSPKMRILLVEDNPDHAELIRQALHDAGVRNTIVTVDTAARALDYVTARGEFQGQEGNAHTCVILLDLRLPDGSGFDVLRVVRERSEHRSTPVVVLTTSAHGPDVGRAYDLGANSYLVKPMNYKQFERKVRAAGLYWGLLNQPPTQ